jgi:hypothetical protein
VANLCEAQQLRLRGALPAFARNTEVAHRSHINDMKRVILGMSEFMQVRACDCKSTAGHASQPRCLPPQVISGSQRFLHRKLELHKKTMVRKSVVWWAVTLKLSCAQCPPAGQQQITHAVVCPA